MATKAQPDEIESEVVASTKTEHEAMAMAGDLNRKFSRLGFFMHRKMAVLILPRKVLTSQENQTLKDVIEGYKLALGH